MFLVTFSGFCSLLVKRGSFSLIQVNELESLPTPPPRSPHPKEKCYSKLRNHTPAHSKPRAFPIEVTGFHTLTLSTPGLSPLNARHQNLLLPWGSQEQQVSCSSSLNRETEKQNVAPDVKTAPKAAEGDTIRVHLTAAFPGASVPNYANLPLVQD